MSRVRLESNETIHTDHVLSVAILLGVIILAIGGVIGFYTARSITYDHTMTMVIMTTEYYTQNMGVCDSLDTYNFGALSHQFNYTYHNYNMTVSYNGNELTYVSGPPNMELYLVFPNGISPHSMTLSAGSSLVVGSIQSITAYATVQGTECKL